MDLKGNGILQLCLNSLSSAERWNGRIQQSATLYQYLAGRDAAVNDAAVQPSFFEGQESFFHRREFYLLNRKNLSRRDKNNKVITSAKAGGNVIIGVCVCVTVYVTVCVTVGKITQKVLIFFKFWGNVDSGPASTPLLSLQQQQRRSSVFWVQVCNEPPLWKISVS